VLAARTQHGASNSAGQAEAAEKGLASQVGTRFALAAAMQVPLDQSLGNQVISSKPGSISASALAAPGGKNVQPVKLAPSTLGAGLRGSGAGVFCSPSRSVQGPLGATAAAALPPVPPHKPQELYPKGPSVKSFAAGKHIVAAAGGPTRAAPLPVKRSAGKLSLLKPAVPVVVCSSPGRLELQSVLPLGEDVNKHPPLAHPTMPILGSAFGAGTEAFVPDAGGALAATKETASLTSVKGMAGAELAWKAGLEGGAAAGVGQEANLHTAPSPASLTSGRPLVMVQIPSSLGSVSSPDLGEAVAAAAGTIGAAAGHSGAEKPAASQGAPPLISPNAAAAIAAAELERASVWAQHEFGLRPRRQPPEFGNKAVVRSNAGGSTSKWLARDSESTPKWLARGKRSVRVRSPSSRRQSLEGKDVQGHKHSSAIPLGEGSLGIEGLGYGGGDIGSGKERSRSRSCSQVRSLHHPEDGH
jgi:hypothetical protein